MPVYNIKPQDVNGGGSGSTPRLYQHNITISSERSYTFTIVILNSNNQELAYNDVLNFLVDNNFTVTSHYDESEQEYIYTGNAYSLGVTGGMSGASGSGCDVAFAFDENDGEGTPSYVIAFTCMDNHGIIDDIDTSSEATVNDIVIPLFQ